MNVFVKAVGGVLIAVILVLVLANQRKDLSVLLTVAVCCMVAALAAGHMQPVLDFLVELQTLGQMESQMLTTVMRAVGIGILSEVTALICTDAGSASMGKVLQILACTVILGMSVPLFSGLISLIEEIFLSI